MSNNKDFQQKPPLGLMPEWLHKEKRFEEIDAAIKRYLDSGKQIPHEWSIEYSELRQWLEENSQFKSANTVEDKYWEILTFFHHEKNNQILKLRDNGYYYWDNDSPNKISWTLQQILDSNCFLIHSVRRNGDNEIFTIGDKLKMYGEDSPSASIVAFTISNEARYKMRAHVAGENWFSICEWEKAPKKEKPKFNWVVFTEDGFGFETWKPKDWRGDSRYNWDESVHTFITKSEADKFITYNRKDYSLNDIKNAWSKGRSFVGTAWLIEQLLKINKEGGNK